MDFYRKTWPEESVTPKLHMLEDHVLEFASKWGLGIGIYSEQGGESIHAEFNSLKRQYWQMHGTKRLQSMMKEHYIRNNPLAKKMKPAVKSRKRKVED